MDREVWVLAEYGYRDHQAETVFQEMLSECRRFAKAHGCQLAACLMGGQNVEEYMDPLGDFGVEKVYAVKDVALSEYSLDAYSFVLETLIEEYGPYLVVIGATPRGSELATRTAARLKLPCITEIKRLSFNEGNLSIQKSAFGDKVYLKFDLPLNKTTVVTILPGDMNVETAGQRKKMEIVRPDIQIKPEAIRTKNISLVPGDPRKIGLHEAELIVTGGKGTLGESFAILEQLAETLGASIGGTRPLVDDGVIPFERQIGITGKSVAPRLLIACGISGAREFTMGIEKAKLILAINSDPKAPIFDVADLGVVGDVNKIIPALIEGLKRKKAYKDKS